MDEFTEETQHKTLMADISLQSYTKFELKKLEKETYKRFKIAKNLNEAMLHQNASGVGTIPRGSKRCPCCGRSQKRQCSLYQILTISPAYSLNLNNSILMYFNFNVSLLKIIAVFILANLLLMYQTHIGYCKYFVDSKQSQSCSNGFNLYSCVISPLFVLNKMIPSKDKELLNDFLESIKFGILLSLLGIWIVLGIAYWVFAKHYKLALNLRYKKSQEKPRIGQYSLMITSFENEDFLKEDFKSHFESLLHEEGYDDPVEILQKVFSTELIKVKIYQGEVDRLQAKIDYLTFITSSTQNFEEAQRRVSRRVLERVKCQARKLKSRLESEIKRRPYLKGTMNLDQLKNSVGFVTLSSPLTRDRVVRTYKNKYYGTPWIMRMCKKVEKPKYVISEAPEPENIEWRHIGEMNLKRFFRRYTTCLLVIVFFVAVVTVLSLLSNSPKNRKRTTNKTISNTEKIEGLGEGKADPETLNMISAYILVELIQTISQRLTVKLCNILEKEFIKSELIFIQSFWLGLLRVIVLVPLKKLVIFQLEDYSKEFIMTAIKVILLQALLKPFLRVLKPQNIIKMLKISWVRLRVSLGHPIEMCQDDLNQLFQKPECHLEDLYSEDIYITSIAFISIGSNPGASIACLAYYIVKICVDRFLLLRFYAEPAIQSTQLSIKMFQNILVLLRLAGAFLSYRQMQEVPIADDGRINYFYICCFQLARFTMLMMILLPFEFASFLIARKLQSRYLLRRTNKGNSIFSNGEDNVNSLVMDDEFEGDGEIDAELLGKEVVGGYKGIVLCNG